MVDFSIQAKPNKTETFFQTDRKRYIGMLIHVKETIKDWIDKDMMDRQMQRNKIILAAFNEPVYCFNLF